MLAWLRTGAIFAECRRKHRPIGTAPSTWTDDDKHDLATDAVVQAILNFREIALVGGDWTPDGGASLKTYFIGACVLAFPTVYRRWKAGHQNDQRSRSAGASHDLDLLGRPMWQEACEPGETSAQRAEIADGLKRLPDERTRVVVAASALGYTQEEIAELLSVDTDTTANNVKQILHRHRRRLEKGETG